MSDYAQSQLELIATFTWPPVRHARSSTVAGTLTGEPYCINGQADKRRHPAAAFEPAQANKRRHPAAAFEPGALGTSVAPNGSVLRQDPALARATDNVACWNTYLPPACVSRMMDSGWHWST
jgi:hypothetical protein